MVKLLNFKICVLNFHLKKYHARTGRLKKTVLHGIFGRDYGFEEPYRGSSPFFVQRGLQSASSAKL